MLLFPYIVAAQVITSEIMYDAPGVDNKAEWVEIQNIGAETIDLTKWKFNDGSSHVLNVPPKNGSQGSLSLASGAYMILASDAATFLSSHAVSVSVIDTVMSLGNDSGKISLVDDAGTVATKASYSSSKGADGTGESLQWINEKFVHAKPTPGAVNSAEKIAKTPTIPVASKTKSQKVDQQKPQPQILDGASTVSPEIARASSTTSAMVAAAVVPMSSTESGFLSWIYGACAVAFAGAAAVFVTRQKKKGEWDIEEIT